MKLISRGEVGFHLWLIRDNLFFSTYRFKLLKFYVQSCKTLASFLIEIFLTIIIVLLGVPRIIVGFR
jgi:hypothetical protein